MLAINESINSTKNYCDQQLITIDIIAINFSIPHLFITWFQINYVLIVTLDLHLEMFERLLLDDSVYGIRLITVWNHGDVSSWHKAFNWN